eukprot:13450482-Alexandrium_andersonii.AAC.1
MAGACNRRCIGCLGYFESEIMAHRAGYQCAPCGFDLCDLCVQTSNMCDSEYEEQSMIVERMGWMSMGPPAGLFHDDPEDAWDD